MTFQSRFATAFVLVAITAGLIATSRNTGADDAPKAAKPAPVAPVQVNKPGSAGWTATTHEAAATEANKKVLAGGKPTTVTGEVVDVSCYLELGKRGEAHIACGSKCIAHGEPVGLVDGKGTLYMLFAEEHHPRRDGMVDIRKVFAPLLAKNVTVTGMVTEMKGVHGLFVQAAEIGGQVVPMEENK
jgi:hypothetical protein